jgi:vWA-MoxR associated protein C-terminal domain
LTYHANALFIETLDPRQAEGAEWNFHFRPVKIDINPHRKYSVDELKGVLCRAVGFCNKNYSVETRDLIVECFLPISLLHLDVEQWPVQEGGLVCGGEFCKAFVVRTSDKSGFLQNKQSFWQQLWRNPTLNCSEALEIIDIANGYKYGNRENPQMVGYRFCVDRNHAQQMNFWGTFLQEGPPIALWIRDSTINPEVAETLMQSLMSRGIGTLVTDLTNYRRDPTILLEVAQVSLLWDNPFRPFPGSEPMFKSQSTTVGL